MKRLLLVLTALVMSLLCQGQNFKFGTPVNPSGETVFVDSCGIVINGHHGIPVMGEIHFSRVPESEWRREILKMKAGGVDVIASYVFWGFHEMEEGVYDWSGNRNLRKFIETCRDCGQKVVLRIGPFCHGEAYLGGIPEWIVDKAIADPENFALRTVAPGFIEAISKFYKEIGMQAEGLLWKDGGPVIGAQIDNESPGPWPYLAKLKESAIAAGIDVPFYTRTGWPKMIGPAVFGELLPLYGDYADGFWDRTLDEMPGSYRAAFQFRSGRMSAVIATEVFGTDQDTTVDKADIVYPYLTCELGGGMSPSYHRRIRILDRDALAMAVCKVGSGSNLPGYYMYHGGTNPYNPDHTMAELQNSKYTNYNDLPNITYDYQAPLGEMGQPSPSYHNLRLFHQLLREWGEDIAVMPVEFKEGDLRWTVRSKDGCGFAFVNNYERLAKLGDKRWNFCGKDILVKDGESFCFPFGMKFRKLDIAYATAQPFCKLRKALYFVAVDGIAPELSINGKIYTPKLDRPFRVKGVKIVVMSPEKALTAYKVSDNKVKFFDGILFKDGRRLVRETWKNAGAVAFEQVSEAGEAREVRMGAAEVAEQPCEADFESAAVWKISVPQVKNADEYFIEVEYSGDVARIYADGVLVQDNFWNGCTMLARVSDLAGKDVELRILPIRKDAPLYLPAEQKEELMAAQGGTLLCLKGVNLIHRIDK